MATLVQSQADYDNRTPDDDPCSNCDNDICCEDCELASTHKEKTCSCEVCEASKVEYCPDCKTTACCCDEIYQAYKERDL